MCRFLPGYVGNFHGFMKHKILMHLMLYCEDGNDLQNDIRVHAFLHTNNFVNPKILVQFLHVFPVNLGVILTRFLHKYSVL